MSRPVSPTSPVGDASQQTVYVVAIVSTTEGRFDLGFISFRDTFCIEREKAAEFSTREEAEPVARRATSTLGRMKDTAVEIREEARS